jgi:hypothetical protein
MSDFSILRVGEAYSPTRRSWTEDVDVNYRKRAWELRLFLARPTVREVEAVRRGPAEFAFLEADDALLFLYRFGEALPWSDKPFSWHLLARSRPEEALLPEPVREGEETRDTLQVVLVDAASGIVKALRLLTFSPSFTVALRLAVAREAERPWPGDAAYDARIRRLYARYPTSAAMLRDATARTIGGA